MIITISREFGSGGKYIGRRLSRETGMKFYDKEILREVLNRTHMNEAAVLANDEISHESYYEGATIFTRTFKGIALDDRIFQIEKQFIESLTGGEDCIVIGRCSDWILRNENTIDIFIFASDKDFKIRRRMKLEKLDYKAAEKRIDEVDKKRAVYHQYHTGQIWGEKTNYDLCIDTSKTGVDAAVEIIEFYYKKKKGAE